MDNIKNIEAGERILKGQFVLSEGGKCGFSDWIFDKIAPWNIQHCPSLKLIGLIDNEDARVGWVLGFPVFAGSAVRIPVASSHPDFGEIAEAVLSDLSGRFVAIIISETVKRVYLDAAGQLAAVYDKSARTVSSSPNAIPSPAGESFGRCELGIPNQDNFYPFGLMPGKRLRRLLPNHYLDLGDFRPTRHWPNGHTGDFGATKNTKDTISNIAEIIQGNLRGISAQYPLTVPLTAGRDSRVLLAASRNNIDNMEFFTTAIPDAGASLDCQIATKLASHFNLKHAVLPWIPAPQSALDQWQRETGACVAGRTWQSVSTLTQLEPGRALAQGLCGEVGRAFYYRRNDLFQRTPLSGTDIVRRLRLPVIQELVDEAEAWLRGLPVSSRHDVLDLLYIEQRLGCWAGPSLYGHTNNPRIPPLSDRRIFSLMLSLPHGYRYRERMTRDLIGHMWPDLLSWPFNKHPAIIDRTKQRARNMRDRLSQVRRIASG